MKSTPVWLFPLASIVFTSACSAPEKTVVETEPAAVVQSEPTIEKSQNRNAYFGDTHIHTRYSFDAYLMGTRSTPDDAYRFAKGDAIPHATGFQMKMKKLLNGLKL